MLQAQGLTKRFGDVSVLQDFDLKVPENGFTVLIGPSGCGKSTLFNILARESRSLPRTIQNLP